MTELNFKKELFGGEIEFKIYASDESSIKDFVGEIIEQMYDEALRLQKIFNIYDKESELSLLNEKRKLKVSRELIEVIRLALKFSQFTKGEYDISLGKNILQRKKGEKVKKSQCSYKNIKINGNEVILNSKDVLIDLGSIAKGFITDKLGKFLKEKGIEDFIINSKGDLIFSGQYDYPVKVQHPRDKEKILFTLSVKNAAVATSGDYNQFYGSFKNSHIINQKEFISITIVAPTLTEADVYATALFVSDKKGRERIIKMNKNIKILLVDKNLNILMFNNFEELISK
jgi:FAD:protein FMN transferase